MNYECPCCGFPKLGGRTYKESFFHGDVLINYVQDVHCRQCGSTYKAEFITNKTKTHYKTVKFFNIVRRNFNKFSLNQNDIVSPEESGKPFINNPI